MRYSISENLEEKNPKVKKTNFVFFMISGSIYSFVRVALATGNPIT